MALALNDVVQVSFRGTLYGQRMLNILHYVVGVVGSGSDVSQLDILVSNILTGGGSVDPRTPFLACIGTEYTLDTIRAQRVHPTRTIYMEAVDGGGGAYGSGTEVTNISASIEKRTQKAGRMGIGRIQIPGVPTLAMNNGELTNAYLTGPMEDLAAVLPQSLTTTGPVVTYVPCLFNPTDPGVKFAVLFDCIPKAEIRTMHRRTLRVGE